MCDALRCSHANKKREALRARQVKERLDLEEAQILEYEHFKTPWAKSLKEFDDKAAEQASSAKVSVLCAGSHSPTHEALKVGE